MTDLTHPFANGPGWQAEQPRRAAAFRAASRHSAHVRRLKWAMVLGSLGAVLAIFLVSVVEPVRHLMGGFSIEGIALDGSRISLKLPRLAGFRQDGRPYEIKARAMSQAAGQPNAFKLDTIEGTIGLADKGVARISAGAGLYDNSAGSIVLTDDVHMTNDTGIEVFLRQALINFKTSGLVSDQPVRVVANTTTITADTMSVSDNGKTFVFNGHVHSIMVPRAQATETASTLKGSSQ